MLHVSLINYCILLVVKFYIDVCSFNVLFQIVRICHLMTANISVSIVKLLCPWAIDLLLTCSRCTVIVYIELNLTFSVIILSPHVPSASLTLNYIEQIYYLMS